MADDYFDPMPVGSTYTMGDISANDPLVDWASNLRKEDLQQFLHDPEGFKNNMINQGIPPPEHHYMATDQGLAPVSPGLVGDPSQGNLTAYTSEDVGKQAPNPWAPMPSRRDTSHDQDRPFLVPPQTKGAGWEVNPPPPPPPPVPEPNPRPVSGIPLPSARPDSAIPRPMPQSEEPGRKAPVATQPESEAAPPEKSNLDKLREQVEEKRLKNQLKEEDSASNALSDFSKTLQGVKMPQRPQLSPPGTIAPRSPVAVHPTVANLLQAVGHAQPQITPLMRLLGRA